MVVAKILKDGPPDEEEEENVDDAEEMPRK
jgi:hypothetical protein